MHNAVPAGQFDDPSSCVVLSHRVRQRFADDELASLVYAPPSEGNGLLGSVGISTLAEPASQMMVVGRDGEGVGALGQGSDVEGPEIVAEYLTRVSVVLEFIHEEASFSCLIYLGCGVVGESGSANSSADSSRFGGLLFVRQDAIGRIVVGEAFHRWPLRPTSACLTPTR